MIKENLKRGAIWVILSLFVYIILSILFLKIFPVRYEGLNKMPDFLLNLGYYHGISLIFLFLIGFFAIAYNPLVIFIPIGIIIGLFAVALLLGKINRYLEVRLTSRILRWSLLLLIGVLIIGIIISFFTFIKVLPQFPIIPGPI